MTSTIGGITVADYIKIVGLPVRIHLAEDHAELTIDEGEDNPTVIRVPEHRITVAPQLVPRDSAPTR